VVSTTPAAPRQPTSTSTSDRSRLKKHLCETVACGKNETKQKENVGSAHDRHLSLNLNLNLNLTFLNFNFNLGRTRMTVKVSLAKKEKHPAHTATSTSTSTSTVLDFLNCNLTVG
jgi:hypothetical protein